MKVTLLGNTSLMSVIGAIRQCWRSEDRIDSYANATSATVKVGPNDMKTIGHVLNNGHTSTLEHLVFNFEITGISRAILQELARHRIASMSVESTRYCLKKGLKKNEISELVVSSTDPEVDEMIQRHLAEMFELMERRGDTLTNDKLKYLLPEAFKTNLRWTINARSLQNFLMLRTSNKAHFEIQKLAWAVYEALPEDAKFLFSGVLHGKSES